MPAEYVARPCIVGIQRMPLRRGSLVRGELAVVYLSYPCRLHFFQFKLFDVALLEAKFILLGQSLAATGLSSWGNDGH